MSTRKTGTDPKARRRSRRPLIRIAIEVRGTDVNGQPFNEITHTLIVNRNGARISLKSAVVPGEQITITNLQRQESCAFRVVERTSTTYGRHAEWGVECLEPERNFWGIYFPQVTPASAQGDVVDVMLECAQCHVRELAQISTDEYRELTTQSKLARNCPACNRTTTWEFGFAEVLLEDARSSAPPEVAEALERGDDRRKTKRFVAMLPLKFRNLSGRTEEARTENLSRLGLCFLSDAKMEVDDAVYLSVGPVEDGKKELPGRVAWKRPVGGSDRAIYGVRVETGEKI
jgi:hypothetical protein